MVTKQKLGVVGHLQNDPLRVIEMLVSVPLAVYGLYLLTPWYVPSRGSVFELSTFGYPSQIFTGLLYLFTGVMMFVAAKSGKIKSRKISLMFFFISMLYSAIFRIAELGFSAITILFIYIAIVLAAVDYLYLNGWRQESNQ
mgnify:CR=1 FL=1